VPFLSFEILVLGGAAVASSDEKIAGSKKYTKSNLFYEHVQVLMKVTTTKRVEGGYIYISMAHPRFNSVSNVRIVSKKSKELPHHLKGHQSCGSMRPGHLIPELTRWTQRETSHIPRHNLILPESKHKTGRDIFACEDRSLTRSSCSHFCEDCTHKTARKLRSNYNCSTHTDQVCTFAKNQKP